MRKSKILSVLLAILLLGVAIAGCNWFRSESRPMPTKKMTLPSARLAGFFPKTPGTRWIYSGYAEYGHEMVLKSVVKRSNRLLYRIEGKVDDVSGGESKRNFNFRLEYVITPNAVYERILAADKPFPHQLKNLKLLALPLKRGARWSQTVIVNNKPTVLKAEVISMKKDQQIKKEKVMVRYRVPMKGMPDGVYEEVREFVAGIGVFRFEKTFGPKPEERFGYSLFRIEIPKVGVRQF